MRKKLENDFEQENNIDFLRILACVMVITIHISSPFVSNFTEGDKIEFIIGSLYNSFSRAAVPIFVMISGRYALSNEKNKYKKYYLKILKKVYIPTAIWTIIYSFARYYYQNIPIKGIVNSILGGTPYYHLWYLYMMIGIYLLVPILIRVKNKIGEKNFFKLGVLLIFVSFFVVLFREFFLVASTGILRYYWKINQLKFINYLGYFILGYSLKNLKIDFSKIGLITLILGIILFLLVQFFPRKWELIYENNNIGVVLYSIFLYLTFQQLNIKKNKFLNLSKYTFGIYLVHPLVLMLDIKIINNIPGIIKIPVKIVIVFVTSLLLTVVFDVIKNKCKREVVS